ncbi:thiamine pyrophosphokinase [Litorivita sp. NS0012-18]|uniref:thiamine pyrophosphokinase n=1 Tax=Litorivita sp. NS0012-18 TaxID=3127655 RepID=UPI003104D747
MIVHKLEPILLVGAGALPEGLWDEARAIAPHVVAVDGGLRHVLAKGDMPEAVIGDLDSIGADRVHVPAARLHPIAEQDSTDFDKALRNVDASLILAAGFSGPRIDHQLAVYSGLMARAERLCIVLGQSDLVMLAPPHMALDLPEGMRLSLYPMGQVRGRSSGLRWPIEGIAFSPQGRIGTSNEVVRAAGAAQGGQDQAGGQGTLCRVEIEVDAPCMLLILPRAALPLLPSSLLGSACGRWTARAGQ